jgi:hypothetical protein
MINQRLLLMTLLPAMALIIAVQSYAWAQEENGSTVPASAAQVNTDKTNSNSKGERPRFKPEEYESMVFTHWEHVAIQDARNYRGMTRDVTDAELMRDLKTREDPIEKVKPPPEEREIRLSGIVYRAKSDWTIWLNEQRVTPEAIPKEVMDLKVYKDYIEFKWFDEYSNKIFPIRLRSHQRFNIDTRIFLPG